jgi:predicted exporter
MTMPSRQVGNKKNPLRYLTDGCETIVVRMVASVVLFVTFVWWGFGG